MDTKHLLALSAVYAAATGLKESTIGVYAANHGLFFSRIKEGRDVTTRRAQHVAQWFSDHWPADLDWPADIPRPDPISRPDLSPRRDSRSGGVVPVAAAPVFSTANEVEAEVKRLLDLADDAYVNNILPDKEKINYFRGQALEVALTSKPHPDGGRVLLVIKPMLWILGATRDQYYDVVRAFADGTLGQHKWPRRKSIRRRLLDALIYGGDRRFASRPNHGALLNQSREAA